MNQKKQTLFWVVFAVLVVLVAGGIVCYAVFADPATDETTSSAVSASMSESTTSTDSTATSSAATSNVSYKLDQFLEGTLSYTAALGDPDTDPEENPAYDGAYDYTYGDLILTVDENSGVVLSIDLVCSATPIEGVALKNFSLWEITATDSYTMVKNTMGDPDDELDDSENLILGYTYQSWYIKLYFDPDTRKLSEISCFPSGGV